MAIDSLPTSASGVRPGSSSVWATDAGGVGSAPGGRDKSLRTRSEMSLALQGVAISQKVEFRLGVRDRSRGVSKVMSLALQSIASNMSEDSKEGQHDS